MTSEKIKTVSVNHHLLPVLRFRSRVWDTLALIIYLKQWFSTRGSFASRGHLKILGDIFGHCTWQGMGLCYWHLVGRGQGAGKDPTVYRIDLLLNTELIWPQMLPFGDSLTMNVWLSISSLQFSSVAQLCPILCDPMNRRTPGLPVHHQLPEFTQTHMHRVGDAIKPSDSLSYPSPPAPSPSQHQGVFQ